jgi:hypothetical protein
MDEYDEYQQVMTTLRRSYNQEKAEQRELVKQEEWKGTVRQQFLSLLPNTAPESPCA